MYNFYFWIIVIILIVSHLLGLYLDRINISMWSDKLPGKLGNIVSQEEYHRSQGYYLANRRFSHISSTVNLVVILSIMATGGFSVLDAFIRHYFSHEILVSLLFFGIAG
ncbi:MAG: M48 family peptidase, partial [Bacteroidia bacterium]